MFEKSIFNLVVYCWFGVGAVTLVSLFFITAPYGRHGRSGWGPAVGPRLGWVLMELLAVAIPAALFATSGRTGDAAGAVFLVLWEIHYVQRTFVYPMLLPAGASPMPISIPLLAIVFNMFNGYLQGGWLYRVAPVHEVSWLADPRFVAGAALFFTGMAINLHADHVLRNLRKPGETGYRVPHGGFYRLVSCPNYLGEVVEWAGWAIATWSLAGAAFAFWTAANLVPRAVAHHRWYREKFPEYPKERRAVFPFVL